MSGEAPVQGPFADLSGVTGSVTTIDATLKAAIATAVDNVKALIVYDSGVYGDQMAHTDFVAMPHESAVKMQAELTALSAAVTGLTDAT
jgi:hypothetical protein